MKNRLMFLGPPGAGKGTQAQIFCSKYLLSHLSTGDLLRAEVEAKSRLGKEAALVMNKGELVSDDLVLSIVEKRLSIKTKGWLLDGFPRNVSQAEALDKLLKKLSQPIESVLLLDLKDEFLIERLLARGREDDNEAVIRHRLAVYREKTSPLIEFYSKLGLIETVQAEGNIKDIASRIEECLS